MRQPTPGTSRREVGSSGRVAAIGESTQLKRLHPRNFLQNNVEVSASALMDAKHSIMDLDSVSSTIIMEQCIIMIDGCVATGNTKRNLGLT